MVIRDYGFFGDCEDLVVSKLTNKSKGTTCIRCGSSDAYKKFLKRREESVVVDPDTGCHLWIGARDGGGYGYVTVYLGDGTKKNYKTHRIVYQFEAGDSVDGYIVMHKCDNPSCCNV
ncbi:HNH endonuclease, partial [Methylophaga sp. UBA5088]